MNPTEASPLDTAAQLVDGLRAQLPPDFALRGIAVKLGELVDLSPDALAAALQALLPGVEVQIEVVAALLRCLDCGAEYPPEEHPCPACGSSNAEMLHGNELEISRAWGERA